MIPQKFSETASLSAKILRIQAPQLLNSGLVSSAETIINEFYAIAANRAISAALSAHIVHRSKTIQDRHFESGVRFL